MIDASHEIVRGKRRHHQARRRARARRGHLRRGRTRHARRRRGGHQGRRGQRLPHRIPTRPTNSSSRRGCDSLAGAIGTSHGAYKFKGQQSLHFDVIEAIQDEAARLRPSSCTAPPASRRTRSPASTPPAASSTRARAASNEDEYLPAAKLGVTKVNIDTDGRLVWTRVHREFFRDKPGEFDFRPPGKIFMDEYAKFIASRNDKLGSAGELPNVRAALEASVPAMSGV